MSGLAAAAFAVLNVHHGMAEGVAVLIAVVMGAAIGAVHGFFFAKVGVPSFVVTLAGLLGWNGLMLYILGSSGTINLDAEGTVAMLTGHYFHDVAVAYGVAALGTMALLPRLPAGRAAARRGRSAVPTSPRSPYAPGPRPWSSSPPRSRSTGSRGCRSPCSSSSSSWWVWTTCCAARPTGG